MRATSSASDHGSSAWRPSTRCRGVDLEPRRAPRATTEGRLRPSRPRRRSRWTPRLASSSPYLANTRGRSSDYLGGLAGGTRPSPSTASLSASVRQRRHRPGRPRRDVLVASGLGGERRRGTEEPGRVAEQGGSTSGDNLGRSSRRKIWPDLGSDRTQHVEKAARARAPRHRWLGHERGAQGSPCPSRRTGRADRPVPASRRRPRQFEHRCRGSSAGFAPLFIAMSQAIRSMITCVLPSSSTAMTRDKDPSPCR